MIMVLLSSRARLLIKSSGSLTPSGSCPVGSSMMISGDLNQQISDTQALAHARIFAFSRAAS